MKGQANRWYGPAKAREAERRAALEREATELLADDRRRRRKKPTASRKPPAPLLPKGWIKLGDLKRARRSVWPI